MRLARDPLGVRMPWLLVRLARLGDVAGDDGWPGLSGQPRPGRPRAVDRRRAQVSRDGPAGLAVAQDRSQSARESGHQGHGFSTMVVGTTSGIPAAGGAEVSPGPRPDGRRSPPDPHHRH